MMFTIWGHLIQMGMIILFALMASHVNRLAFRATESSTVRLLLGGQMMTLAGILGLSVTYAVTGVISATYQENNTELEEYVPSQSEGDDHVQQPDDSRLPDHRTSRPLQPR